MFVAVILLTIMQERVVPFTLGEALTEPFPAVFLKIILQIIMAVLFVGMPMVK